ncbi:hypothetical protein ACIBO6_06600 [Streptomyces luteogriseus]|uniref:hypothetical protein n=1 Tax=Streptomyces luteogriseus TaxID=68233 RepID=UPI0037898BDE
MDERLTAALLARVNTYISLGDASQVLADEGVAEAAELRRTAATDPASGAVTVRHSVLHALGWFHWCRHDAQTSPAGMADLRKALDCFAVLLGPRPDAVPEQLAAVLRAEARRTPEETDRDGFRLLRELGPDHDRYLLDHAVRLLRTAAPATSDAGARSDSLNALSVALHQRFEWFGEVSDQNDAIEAGRAAVTAAIEAGLPAHTALSNLAVYLRGRFQRTSDAGDLDEAVDLGRQAATARNLGNLSMLALTLRARGEHRGSASDLDEAVEILTTAVAETGTDDSALVKRLGNLVSVLSSRFDLGHDPGDLDHAVTAAEGVLERVGLDHPHRAGIVWTLSNALQHRYERTGDEGSLAAAIDHCRAAPVAPATSAEAASRLSQLDILLRLRFSRHEELTDLDQAITAAEGAVSATPEQAPVRAGYLSNLALGLRTRGNRTGSVDDLSAAVDAARAAVALQPLRQTDHAGHLSNLASAVFELYGHTRQAALLDEALDAARRSVELTPAGDTTRPGRLMNLGIVLRRRHSVLGADAGKTELDEAIRVLQASTDQVRTDAPGRALMLLNLGLARSERFRLDGDRGDANAAIEAHSAAASLGHALSAIRFEASSQWGEIAAITGQWPAAAEGYEVALDTLLLLASLHLSRAGRERLLSADGVMLASDAAAAALQADRTVDSVRFLEQGRAVLWSQSLHLGTDAARLARVDSALADRLTKMRRELYSLDGEP